MLSDQEFKEKLDAWCSANLNSVEGPMVLDAVMPPKQLPLILDDDLDSVIDSVEEPVHEMYRDTATNMIRLPTALFYRDWMSGHVNRVKKDRFAAAHLNTVTQNGDEPVREILVLAVIFILATNEKDPTPYLEKYIYTQELYRVFRNNAQKYLDEYIIE